MRVAAALVASCLAVAAPSWAGPEPPRPESPAPLAAPPVDASPADVPPSTNPAPDPGLPARTDVTLDRANRLVAVAGFGGPLGATLRLDLLHGLGADVRGENEHVKAVCALPIPHCARGFLLGAEAGSGGGKLSLGVGANARVESDDFHGTVGVALALSLARTWGSPVGTRPGLGYLGPELQLGVLRFGVSLGALWRISGSGGDSLLFSWGIGIRL